MKPLTSILLLPVADPQSTAAFYAEGLGLETNGVEDGIVAFELPNLSIFFISADEYSQYLELSGQPGSKEPGRQHHLLCIRHASRDRRGA